jgi:hypothetical protein
MQKPTHDHGAALHSDMGMEHSCMMGSPAHFQWRVWSHTGLDRGGEVDIWIRELCTT